MIGEYSCGAVVFVQRAGQRLFVLVQEMTGAYSFPKGHREGNETEEETARREIFEETGLHPAFVDGYLERDVYDLAEKPGMRKQVTYFLAECRDEVPIPRAGEIQRIVLANFEDAYPLLGNAGSRRALTTARDFLDARAKQNAVS